MVEQMTVYKVLRVVDSVYYSSMYDWLPSPYLVEYTLGQQIVAPTGTLIFAFEDLESATAFHAALSLEDDRIDGVAEFEIRTGVGENVEYFRADRIRHKVVNLRQCIHRNVISEMFEVFWDGKALSFMINPEHGTVGCSAITLQV